MNILCVEDEMMVGRLIEQRVRALLGDRLTWFGHVLDCDDAETILAERAVDVLLLDLNLSGQSGFTLLARFTAGAFQTIIISANTDQAFQAFQYGVVDFIGKPFTAERLETAFARLGSRIKEHAGCRFLTVQRAGVLERVALEDIHSIQAKGDYSQLNLMDGNSRLHNKNLERLLVLLPMRFIRIHKSHVVDARHIVRLHRQAGSRYHAELKDGTMLPVGRSRFAAVNRHWQNVTS